MHRVATDLGAPCLQIPGKALDRKAQHHGDGRDARTAAQLRQQIRTATEENTARLAQSVERKALNLVVVGSSPTVGAFSQREI